MNHYPFHVGDYAKETRHLTVAEDLAYRRILDLYYSDEVAPEGTPKEIARRVAMVEHADCVEQVLNEFFVRNASALQAQSDGSARWTHKRVEAELKRYRDKKKQASKAAATRWASSPNADALRSQCGRYANQNHNQNHEPEVD